MWTNGSAVRLFALLLCCCAVTSGAAAQGGNPASSTARTKAAHRTSASAAEQLRVPAVRWFTDRPRQYVLLEPFKYEPPRSSEPIVVPAGFVTDFASIPGPFQPLFGPSTHDLPALVHDFLYWRQSCGRERADEIFYVALDQVGVSKARRMGIRLGLFVGGADAYRDNARQRGERLPRIIPPAFLQIPVTTWEDYRKELRREGVALDAPDPKPPLYCR